MSEAPPSLETVRCNCCGSARQRAVYQKPDALFHPDEWFTVVECLDCGLGFVNPRPTASAIFRHYPPAFYTDLADAGRHLERYRREAEYLSDVAHQDGRRRLLDVGCANGDFPRHMRELGWDVEGVEIGPNAAAIADFPVHRVPLDRVPGSRRFEALTAWAVLEHVHDPRAYFAAAGRLLRPGGRFVFLVTNFDSLSSRALFREDVPRHLHFFTEATVRRYVSDAGLSLTRAVHTRSIYEMRPLNAVYYALRRWRGGAPLAWEDLPEGMTEYRRRTGRQGAAGAARWALAHPVAAADRLASVGLERWQILTRRYGIVVYVAERVEA